MNEKIFRFHGLSFEQIIAGVFLLTAITLIGFFVPIVLFDIESPAISFIGTVFSSALFLKVFGKYLPKLWTIKIAGDVVEIYFGSGLKERFSLSELEKIHIRGWNKKQTYRLLRLTVRQRKINVFVDNTGNTNKITADKEIKIFDEAFSFLELYAATHNYERKDLRKTSAPADFKNYYYLRK